MMMGARRIEEIKHYIWKGGIVPQVLESFTHKAAAAYRLNPGTIWLLGHTRGVFGWVPDGGASSASSAAEPA